jgi:histidinol-phosphate aminotransferase
MTAPRPVPHPAILDIKPYIGGEAKAAATRLHRLASNENPLGTSPRAAEAYRALAGDLHRYPDGAALALREAIGEECGLPPERIVCGAGSDELLGLLVRAYAGPGDEVIHSRHGFLMYPIMARIAGAIPVSAPEASLRTNPDAIVAAITPRTKVIVLANPNNPTGSYLTEAEVRALHARIPPHVLLVLDSAYAEYATAPDYSAGAELADEFENVAMTRTFSKIYGLAALRLGWCYAPQGVIDVLNRVRDPFNTNAAAIAAGVAAMRDHEFVERSRDTNDRMRPWLAERLQEMDLRVYPSLGNFLLVSFPPHSAEEVRLFLKDRGVLVRQMGAYGLADCLRITVGDRDDMQAVADGVHAFLMQANVE